MAAAKKTVGKYEIGRTLGEGTFGKVKYAVNTETTEAVAIKVLDKERIQKQSMGSQIKKEISIMKQLQHKNIVKLNEVLASRTKIFIVLELVVGGELFDLIVKSGRLSETEARHYFRQLVDGVWYCHSQGVAHRDLKPENLLLDAELTLKISDFGLSALYDGDEGCSSREQLLHTTCGTPNYVAPEVLENEGYEGRCADCWSIGVILYVLLSGFLPFDEPTMAALFKKIKAADYSYPDFFTTEMTGLIDTILVADPLHRATLADVKNHPWFLKEDPAKESSFLPVLAAAPAPSAPVINLQHTMSSTRVTVHVSPKPVAEVVAKLRAALLVKGAEIVEVRSKRLLYQKTPPRKPVVEEEEEEDPDDEEELPDLDPTREKIEATHVTANGAISVLCLVRKDKTGTKLELLRGKGDILAYSAFVNSILFNLTEDLQLSSSLDAISTRASAAKLLPTTPEAPALAVLVN